MTWLDVMTMALVDRIQADTQLMLPQPASCRAKWNRYWSNAMELTFKLHSRESSAFSKKELQELHDEYEKRRDEILRALLD